MTPTLPRPARPVLAVAKFLKFAAAGLLATTPPATAQSQRMAPSDAAARLNTVSGAANTPEDRYGKLYQAVELAHVFPDGKAFADMVPRTSPSDIITAYVREQPATRVALAAFVDRFFAKATLTERTGQGLRAHIRGLWPVLTRAPLAVAPGSSSLQLPAAYVVPGGRFQEIYYWDSYFTMLGLRADGQQTLVDAMLTNFVSLIERYGHIPNGTRSYYLSRSQPPFFALMLDLSTDTDSDLARKRLAALKTEYTFWMAGSTCLDRSGACQHVVRMPDGSLLNRYWDARDTPRDESYAEDTTTAAAAPRAAKSVYRDLRAGAESGWDFGSRWLRDGKTLASIHTTEIVPIDLNSLLWFTEKAIARRCAGLGDQPCAVDFTSRAQRRAAAIDRYLWFAAEDRFGDWDVASGHATPTLSAATLFPLFVGLASPAQAQAVARTTASKLLAPGGLRTTLTATGQQWDTPNGWAPLQWIAISGLDRSGNGPLARTIADRWLATVNAYYRRTGKVIEKYNVEQPGAGGGGEYDVQEGFGWTNGVTSAVMDLYKLIDSSLQ